MISSPARWIRFALSLALLLIFGTLAYLLYNRQQARYTYDSFHVTNESCAVIFPNIDRLKHKIQTSNELLLPALPPDLESGIQGVLNHPDFQFSDELSKDCYLSFNETDFLLAFRTTSADAEVLAGLGQTYFGINASVTENGLTLNGKNYLITQFNHYLVISTQVVTPVITRKRENFGNADFVVFSDAYPKGQRHILSEGMHQLVWEDSLTGPQGSPILHAGYLPFIPASFDKLSFYGSQSLETDAGRFFGELDQNTFAWADAGMLWIQKDSFQFLIAPQNTNIDLKLLLEEQTLAARGDTSFIPFFTIGSHEVMPFTSSIHWNKAFPELNPEFSCLTLIDNFNVLSNSIPAMRWYLGELQLGNLFLKSHRLRVLYEQSLPQRAHQFSILQQESGNFTINSSIWNSTETCIQTLCQIGESTSGNESVTLLADFECAILPTAIQTVRQSDSLFILVSNLNQLVLYDTLGALRWRLNLTTDLTGAPQIIDLENDGIHEIVLFQKDQLDILTISGKSCPGLPEKYNGLSRGGIAVNYDDAYNYRFLVNVGNQIRSLDESGSQVQGWMFTQMAAELQGSVSYYVTQGKDMISFKDISNNQYVINRRGESRLTKSVKVNLPNESGFVVGAYDEASLRKLGYRNNYIFNFYLMDGHKDSVKVDKPVNALSAKWVFNNNQPLLVIEETERVVVLDEFGYEKESVLKPEPNQSFAGLVINQGFEYVFADNSQNALYLLDGFGKMIFPVPVTGSSVFHLKDRLLYTFVGTKIKVYKTE